jgi:uncharacterized protein YdaT
MPWNAQSFKSKHNKRLTSSGAKKASSIGNALLKKGYSDESAIRIANSKVKKEKVKKPPKFNMRKGYTDHGKAF